MSVPIERKILEAYCVGKGINVGCGKVQIADSIGVDIDQTAKMVRVIADGKNLPFEDGEMDYVISLHCLEHFDVSPIIVLKEWHRVLRNGGICAVIVPDGDRGMGAFYYPKDEGIYFKHFLVFTLQTLPLYFQEVGFEIKECRKIDRNPERPEMTLLCVGVKK